MSFSDWGKKKNIWQNRMENHFPMWLKSENMSDKKELQSNSRAGSKFKLIINLLICSQFGDSEHI